MEHRNSREVPAPQDPTTPPAPAAPRARASQMGGRRTAMRIMQRRSQGVVAVYEQDPTAANSGMRTLVFETPTRCTRISEFPADWQLLSDDALSALGKKKADV